MDHEKALRVISQAWGKKQVDEFYCFFPWIDREEQRQTGIRRAGYHEGPAFKWPADRDQILRHMSEHEDHDLYWCPSLFEQPTRSESEAADERALWADLDEVDPRSIEDYPPSIAWETSPGRYQALWVLNQGDIQGASWPGKENQRLTYHIGADVSGWDTTQLLRIPGWKNHKLEYEDANGENPVGKLLWTNGRRYLPDDFEDLPEVAGALPSNQLTDVVAQQIEQVDINAVRARIRLQLTRHTREMLDAKEAHGDRSSALWDLERSLADVGCTIEEIVALVRNTVWNKYATRGDELKRLITEASKAIAAKADPLTKDEVLRDEADSAVPQRLDQLLANIKPPKWLVKDILTIGGLGFIAGEPKSFKSWVGLDLAVSIATGSRFLNTFDVMAPGPVLYLQEEDSPSTIKIRYSKVLRSKKQAQVHLSDDGKTVEFHPPAQVADAPINALLQGGLVLSEGVWQEWLDETLSNGFFTDNGTQLGYQLVIIDTLMMVAGSVEENRAQDMTTKLFKPLKQIARKHNTALILIHHMRKGSNENGNRGGQRMLGSVANHAWSEDAMYLQLGKTKSIELSTESKSFESRDYMLSGVGSGTGWDPRVDRKGLLLADPDEEPRENKVSRADADMRPDTQSRQKLLLIGMAEYNKPITVSVLAETTRLSPNAVRRGLKLLDAQGRARRINAREWVLTR